MTVLEQRHASPEPKRRKTAHDSGSYKPSPLAIQSFPHILDAVIDGAAPEALRALRATCRDIKKEIDKRFAVPTHMNRRVGPNDHTTAERPGAVYGANVETGLRVKDPINVQVVDMDARANELWYAHGLPYLEADEEEGDRYLRKWVYHKPGNEFRLETNNCWFSMEAPLARYMPSKIVEVSRKRQALRYDPLSVYFCNLGSFSDNVRKLSKYHRVEAFSHGAPGRTTIFNVSLALEDNPPGQRLLSFPDVQSNRFTVLFTSPDFEESARQLSHTFMKKMLRTVIRNYIEYGEPRACLVGCERLALDMFPRPNDDAYWSSVNCQGPMKDFKDSAYNRLTFWINYYVWVYEYKMDEEELQELGVNLEALPHLSDPVKLLTLAEWKEQIGETYFELMTDPKAMYRSKEPLPPFKAHADE